MSIISKQRELLFDNLRGVLIFLVVLGHALEYFRLTNQTAEFFYVFIYLFHMPVFIFISGYFSKQVQKGRKTAVKTFLIPYLILNFILSIILLMMGKIETITILNPGWTLWYLYCMFIWRLLLPDLIKVRHILILSFIIGIFSGFLTEFGTYMALARTLGFLPFFLAGYYTDRKMIEKLRHFPFARLLGFMVIILGLVTAFLWVKAPLPPEILWGDRAYNLFEIPLWQNILADLYLYGLGFAFVFAFLVMATEKRHFYTVWGQNTLAIYLLHIYLIAPIVQIGEFVVNPILHALILIGGSLLTVYILSRPKVTHRLSIVLKQINHWIMPDKKS